MRTISFEKAASRSRYTAHGLMLLEVVRKNPGIPLETLVREHDPPSPPFAFLPSNSKPEASVGARIRLKDALRRFPPGGRAVKQLCDAGALVITEALEVYRPEDLPDAPSAR